MRVNFNFKELTTFHKVKKKTGLSFSYAPDILIVRQVFHIATLPLPPPPPSTDAFQ